MKKTHLFTIINGFLLLFLLLPLLSFSAESKPLVIYSERSKHLIAPFIDAYEKQMGIQIEYVNDKAAVLRQRLILEGENTPADLLLTVDAGNLWRAEKDGLLAEIKSEVLERRIPPHLRSPSDQWVALTIRARTIVYSADRVSRKELSNYEQLADQSWKNRLCLRTSKKVYNQSLVAMLLHHYGETKTKAVLEGWVNNLSRPPYAKDSQVIHAIFNGECDVGLVNTYYYAREIRDNPSFQRQVKLFWAGQGAGSWGTHINISGIGIVKHSRKKAEAQAFVEWLTGLKVQSKFASINLEYPVILGADLDPVVESWGNFIADESPVYIAGEYQARAVKLMDIVGYK